MSIKELEIFTPKTVYGIRKNCESFLKLTPATISSNYLEYPEYRQSEVARIEPNLSNYWLFGCLKFWAQKHSKHKLILPFLQYTVYRAPEGHYTWHTDAIDPKVAGGKRVLSMSVQLSEPEDYTGGELEFKKWGFWVTQAPKTLGCGILFTANDVHRVKPVTSGTRRSLVAWFLEKPEQ